MTTILSVVLGFLLGGFIGSIMTCVLFIVFPNVALKSQQEYYEDIIARMKKEK